MGQIIRQWKLNVSTRPPKTPAPAPAPPGPQAPLGAFGQQLSSPGVPSTGSLNLQDPASISALLSNMMGQANLANEARYGQGLGVLTGGHGEAKGAIGKAIELSEGFGESARRRVSETEQRERGRSEQDLISRGLGNSTVRETMLAGVGRRAEDARQDIDEQAANRQAQLQLQLANQANLGSGRIADFIGNRTDAGPDLSMFANLIQGATAAQQASQPRTVRSTAGSITAANQLGPSFGPFSQSGGAITNAIGGGSAPAAPATQTYFGPGTGNLNLRPGMRAPTGTSTIGQNISTMPRRPSVIFR